MSDAVADVGVGGLRYGLLEGSDSPTRRRPGPHAGW